MQVEIHKVILKEAIKPLRDKDLKHKKEKLINIIDKAFSNYELLTLRVRSKWNIDEFHTEIHLLIKVYNSIFFIPATYDYVNSRWMYKDSLLENVLNNFPYFNIDNSSIKLYKINDLLKNDLYAYGIEQSDSIYLIFNPETITQVPFKDIINNNMLQFIPI